MWMCALWIKRTSHFSPTDTSQRDALFCVNRAAFHRSPQINFPCCPAGGTRFKADPSLMDFGQSSPEDEDLYSTRS